jgi:translation initiation factor 2A
MDIYDLEKDYTKVCTIEASNAPVCEWSPDGNHILTATTSPRLRVDNGIRIWHVGGGIMYNEDMTELYHVTWRPQSTLTHPLGNPLHPVPTPHASALAYLGTVKTPSKPAGAYRPPGARGTSTPLHFKREDEGGAAYNNNGISSTSGHISNGFGKPRRREVPGAEPVEQLPPGAAPGGGVSLTGTGEGEEVLSKAALKNKKKREAKKAKEAAEKAAGLAAGADGEAITGPANPARGPDLRGGRGHERSRSKNGGFGSQGGVRSPSHQRGYQGNSPHRRNNSGYDDNQNQGQNHNQHYNSRYQNQPTQHHSRHGSGFQGNPRQQQQGQQQHQQPQQQEAPIVNLPPTQPVPPPMQIQTQSQPAAAAAPDLTVTSPGDGGGPGDKKVRSLLKKIRAIDDLKMRQAGGEKLEDTQVKKIGTEESIRKELRGLGFTE